MHMTFLPFKLSSSKRLILTCVCFMTIVAAMQGQESDQRVQPTLFGPGTISTGDMELNAAFTPDGRTLYFTKRTPKYQLWTILVSTLNGGRWSVPRVAEFSGQYGDFDPFISPNGSQLFFSSNRLAPGKTKYDFDIWVVNKTGAGWTTAERFGTEVNTETQEYYPSVSKAGTLYFSSNREGGKALETSIDRDS